MPSIGWPCGDATTWWSRSFGAPSIAHNNTTLITTMTDAYILDGVRTAVGNIGGQLAGARAHELPAHVISRLLKRDSSLDPAPITDGLLASANHADDDKR